VPKDLPPEFRLMVRYSVSSGQTFDSGSASQRVEPQWRHMAN